MTGKVHVRRPPSLPPSHRSAPLAPPPMPPLRAVPPPLPPPLRSVPPPARPIIDVDLGAKTLPFEDPTVLDDRPGALMRQSTMVRVFDETRALVVRIFERVRVMQQLRTAVAIQRATPRAFDTARVNKLVVSTYKLVGFALLTLIALALISYLGANVFYWFSTSWIEPTVIAPTDERVLALSTQLLQQASARDKVAAELADAERVMTMHQDFLEGARKALQDELADRKGELSRLLALDRSFTSTRAEVAHNGRAYSDMSKHQLAAEYGAHFIDKQTAVAGALQLSQIAQGNLSLAEKSVELYKRRAELSRETEALGVIVGQRTEKTASRHSIEVLKILQDVKRAEVELAKARDNRVVLQRSLERYDKMVKTLSESAFLRAVDGKDSIAFVPYENLDRIKPGTPLYGCWIGPLFCRRVGSVVALLPGEMSYKHPLHNSQLRGQPVQLQLANVHDAERKVLFAGGRPILF
ncbi:MAG: hypothetical protein JWM53_1832 [bacterium]|nr:hypothetical protein [bacterium]